MDYLRENPEGILLLTVYVQPGASREGITGLHGGAVKLCITAPAVEDKANLAATRFLARLFSLSNSAVTLRHGSRSRIKKFHLHGLSRNEARTILTRHLPEPADSRSE
jgi:uncharacterized protein